MIKVNNLSVSYNNIKVLKNITFDVKKGKILGIIGTNGSGKTTLLKCIMNILDYDGDIFIENKNIKNIKRKDFAKKICMLSQINNIYFNHTIFDTVMMGRYAYQNRALSFVSKEDDIFIVNNAIKTVGIYDIRHKEIDLLSGGQLQRVFLAKLIAQNPDIILLDEPTNHLDFKYQIEIINFFKNWAKKENKTIISVLHDINLSINLSEDILILQNGSIKTIENIHNILKSNVLNKIYDIDIKSFMLENLKKWEIF